jgi:hypothetical protein
MKMLKKMFATTAIATMLTAPAFAQDTMEPIDPPATEPGFDAPVMDDPMIDDPMMEDPMMDDPAFDEPAVDAPIVDEPVTDADPLAAPAGDVLIADDVVGADLVNFEDERIASVDDVVLDPEGNVEAALVDIGGFLGFGGRTVAIPAADLTLETDENGETFLRTSLTRDALDDLPEYEAPEEDWIDADEM